MQSLSLSLSLSLCALGTFFHPNFAGDKHLTCCFISIAPWNGCLWVLYSEKKWSGYCQGNCKRHHILTAPHNYLPYISAAQLDSTSPILIGDMPTKRSENWNQVCSGRLINKHPILLLTDMWVSKITISNSWLAIETPSFNRDNSHASTLSLIHLKNEKYTVQQSLPNGESSADQHKCKCRVSESLRGQ